MPAGDVLRVFCASCRRERVGDSWIESAMPSLDVEPVSHGLCLECARALEGDARREQPILDALRARRSSEQGLPKRKVAEAV